MTVPKSVRAWVADAEASYGDGLDAWFPQDFSWRDFCADAPELAARLGERWRSSTAAAGKARLEELAQAAFRGAYVGGLALLAAFDAEAGPDEALDRLVAPLSAAEQDALSDTLAADLESVEEILNDAEPSTPPSARAVAAAQAAQRVRPTMRELLEEGLASGAKALVSLGAGQGPMSKVLSGVVNVAVALAGLRYALAAEIDVEEGRPPLAVDPVAMGQALGDPEAEADALDGDEDDAEAEPEAGDDA